MPPGWGADTCAAAGAACAAAAPPPPAAARALGVGAEGLASLWHQRRGAAARARAAAARRRAPELAAAWRGGDTLVSVAARFDVDDDAAARVIHDAVEGRKLVKASDVRDARLRNEVKALGCFGEAARGAAARREIGLEYERLLRRALERSGVPFEDEDALRARGFARTPDVLLTVPLGVLADGATVCVNWIDSKAMFGGSEVYERDHRSQLRSYVNRLGAGCVVYWFGYDRSICRDSDILVLDGWPPPYELLWPDGTNIS